MVLPSVFGSESAAHLWPQRRDSRGQAAGFPHRRAGVVRIEARLFLLNRFAGIGRNGQAEAARESEYVSPLLTSRGAAARKRQIHPGLDAGAPTHEAKVQATSG